MQFLSKMDHDIPAGDGGLWGESASAAIHAMEQTPSPTVTVQPVTAANVSPAATPSGDFIARGGQADAPIPAPSAVLPPSSSHKKAVLQKLASTVSVSRAYAACVVERADYEKLYLANHERVHLEEAIKTHRALIASETNFDVIQAAHEKLALLESPSASAARDAVCSGLRERQLPLCCATKALLEVAIREIENLSAQAAQEEGNLAARWQMDRFATPISRSIAAVKSELLATQSGVKPMQHSPFTAGRAPSPGSFDHAINLFEA